MANPAKAQKERLEFMREQVLEVELQSRYWKAMHDTKFFTLADDKLKSEYNTFIEKAQADAMAEVEALQKESETAQDKVLTADTLSTN